MGERYCAARTFDEALSYLCPVRTQLNAPAPVPSQPDLPKKGVACEREACLVLDGYRVPHMSS